MVIKKKWIAMIEMLIYIFFSWWIIYTISIIYYLLNDLYFTLEKVDLFQNSYKTFVLDFSNLIYDWFIFTGSVWDNLLYNNWEYKLIWCLYDWIVISENSYSVPNINLLDSSNSRLYDWFNCLNITIYPDYYFWWTYAYTNIWYLERTIEFNHYIK